MLRRDVEQVFNLLRTGHRMQTCAPRRLPLGEASAVDPPANRPLQGRCGTPYPSQPRVVCPVTERTPHMSDSSLGGLLGFYRWRGGKPAKASRVRLSGRTGAGLDPCAAMQVQLLLDDGEQKTVLFTLGAACTRAIASWS